MTAPDAVLGERYAAVLAEHQFDWGSGYCACGWAGPAIDKVPAAHSAHAAAALAPIVTEEVAAAEVRALREALVNEQARRCSYGTREGDGRTCDCKFASPLHRSTEQTGCPEMRVAIWTLDADRIAATQEPS